MKILFITQFFDATRGGGEVAFYLIAKQLAKKGHRIYVVRHKISDGDCLKDLPSNLLLYDINPPLKYAGGLPATIRQNLSYLYNAVRFGLKIVKREDIDIIHTNNYTPVFAGTILSKLTARPLVITIHDVALTNGLTFWKKWMRQFEVPSLIHSLIGYTGELLTLNMPVNVIHTVSKTSREDILKFRKKSPIFVIPNGIDLTMYKMKDSEVEYGDEMVFIGRAVYYKNLEVVLKAMKVVVRRNPNAKLVVIGDGPMKPIWQRLATSLGIGDNVDFLGYVPHEEKISVLKRATALLLPSTWEGFGMVILEAWALKKPVIVSRVRPLTELVDHRRNGFHAHPYNSAKWAEFMEHLLTNKSLAREMGEAGYSKLIENFTIQETVSKLEKLYIRLCMYGERRYKGR